LNPKHYFNHLDLRFAFEDLNGCIWFLHALEGYLFRFEPEGEKLKMTFVPNWSIFHAVLDSRGNFWFACGANNIWNLVLNGVPFTGQLIPNRFNVSGISASLVAENTEYLWLVLSDGVFRSRKDLSGSSLKREPFLFRDGGTYASAVRKDKSGFLWFGRDGGKITRLGKKPEEVKDFYLPDKHTCPVTDFLEDRNGNMWIISPYVIFLKPHGSERIEVFKKGNRELEKAMGGGIYNVLLDSSDNLWFATFGNGVYCFNTGSGKTVFQGKSEGLDIPFGDYCMKMAEDSRGRIWTLWYRNGLRLYDPSSGIFTETDIAKGEGLINYMDVYIDENDRMMVAHTGGFSFCDIQADSAWNISHNLSAGGCFTYKTSTGQLLFISGQQLLCFRKKNNINTAVPPLAFSSILVNGQEYKRLHPDEYDLNSTKSIKLKHSENNLQISFSSLDLTEPKLNHYKYFMKGIDRDTIYVKYDGRIAVYRKMRPGRYKFWFTGSNNHDIWNSPGKSVDIIISPPWYTSKLSFIIYLLFFTGTLFGLYRWRIRNMRVEKEALEKHIRERTAELELKNRLISEMDNLKTKFFSEISHEIRTPLSLIVGPVDTLLRENKGKIDESSYSWMKMIQRNANRLLALVNQLLDIAKLDSGRMKLNLLNDDINKCLRLTAFGFLSLAETRKITFRVNIPSNKCITCFDRDKIEKILSNLLVNAFKFTPSGGTVILTAEVDQKEVPGQAFLHLSVSDTGVGIDAADLPKIFERFYSSEGQWEKDGKGTGIGLSLVNEFVGMMNGKINVSSESGKGFLFSISIPMPLPVQEDIEDYPEYQPEAELHIGKNTLFPIYESDIKITPSDNGKPHLLVVEDNDDLRYYIMENMLSDYVVTECNNGNEGLRMAISGIPDIVLSDIILPGLGGTELCQKLKNDERTSHIIVLLLTAKTSQTDKIEGLESGADDYIFKPFDLTELRTRMSNLLKQRERLRNKYGLLTGFETTGAKIETADDKFMSKITAIIRSRIHDFEFDVGALQEEIGMSRVHLYRKLKAITGLAPHELIKNYRMKEAARLIGIKAGNIAEIAISVGFSNPSYFSTTFREYYGISPKDYKAPGK
jgi:signal transduction histidine kinase/DNA-binding response OmpR family regulator/streptogramin lyase